jgi:fermentation-respiration switch protein FrsA (DUF1100 family)
MKGFLLSGALLMLLISGCLAYTNRPPANYTQTVLSEDGNATMYKLSFDSKGQTIYALLAIPKNSPKARSGKIPAFFDLYGATMTKEGEYVGLGQDLVQMGFAVLIIDQRGWGETAGFVPSIQADFSTFRDGREPVQHMMVYDGLRAYDILKSRPEVDPSRIYAAGQSMGGRYAMIAASIEKGIAGALIISSSGFGLQQQQDPEAARFLNSIDPDHFVASISPRPFIMAHSRIDPVIPFAMAQATFGKAGEPKKFLETDSKDHAYIRKDMKGLIGKELEGW